jgi:hypothetical protein
MQYTQPTDDIAASKLARAAARFGTLALLSLFSACADDPSEGQRESAVSGATAEGSQPSSSSSSSGGSFGALPATDGRFCAEQAAQSMNELAEAAASADARCTVDADCTVTALVTSCASGCSVVVSELGAARIQAVAAAQSTDSCAGFEELGCVHVVQPCPALGRAACVAGACRQLDDG